MSIAKFLTIICIALFSLLGIFLIFKRHKKSPSNLILGSFFILWGLNFLDGYLLLDGFYLQYPSLALWEDSLVFLYGPLIYFYARALVDMNPVWDLKALYHLIPFGLLFITTIIMYHLQPVETKIEVINSIMELNQPLEVFFLTVVVFAHILSYFFVANSLLNNRLNDLKNHYSTLNTIWFITTLRFLIVIVLASLAVSILQYYGNRRLFEIGLVILILIILIFISQVLFKALDQPLLFVHRNSEKYGASNLTSELQQAILTQLKSVLEGDKMFLQADLTLTDLSRSVSASPRHVSQIINDHFNKNFFDLINSYRIQEARRVLKNARDPKLTVLEVMYQVGFNSKSSFNTQFKKKTGLTPSEFKRLHS